MRELKLLAGVAVLAMFTMGAESSGCFGGGTDDPDPELNFPKTCTATADCLSDEVCHPIGKVCVKNCETDATVCGDDECVETMNFDGESAYVCKCSTCSVDGEVCSADLDDVCESRCTSSSDCAAFTGQNRECSSEGLCVFAAVGPCNGGCPTGQVCDTNIDSCIDACTAASCNSSAAPVCGASGLCEACSVDADCAGVGTSYTCDKTGAAPVCVSSAVTCNASNPAPGSNFGPDTCNYGDVCSNSVCVADALPDRTCAAASSTSWDPTNTRHGPVITVVSAEAFTGTGVACNGATDRDCCANGAGGFRVDIEFYAPNGIAGGSWTAKSQQIKFVKPDGTIFDAGHFADFPDTGATYSIKPLHAGGCAPGITGIDPTGYAVYLVDAEAAGGNPACL